MQFPYLAMRLHGAVGHVLVQHLLLHHQDPLVLLPQVGCLSGDRPLRLPRSLTTSSGTSHVGRHHGVLDLTVPCHGRSHPLTHVVHAAAAEVTERFCVVVGQHGGCLLLLLCLLFGQSVLVYAVWLLLSHHAHGVVREVVVHGGFRPIVRSHPSHQRALWCVKDL